MFMRNILAVVLLAGLLAVLGCGGNPTSPVDNSDMESFFAGVQPVPTGIVGNYVFTLDNGERETGKIVRDESGTISLVPDRASAVLENSLIKISIDYLNPRGYTGMGLPIYYLGDNIHYEVCVENKTDFPMNAWPWVYGYLKTEQRYYPGGGLLPGNSVEIWNPFELAPYGTECVDDWYQIPNGTVPGNDATWALYKAYFAGGCCELELISGVAGLWDP